MPRQKPRIIIFSGKGGVGKTTVSAATALQCAAKGWKTIVISIDIAHSLTDAFELETDLHNHNRGMPRTINANLDIQEVDIQEELERYWGEISKYLAALIGSTGITNVLAEELAIIPGMEEVVNLLYINQYYRDKTYDVIIVDCAPTGESLRFISMPSTLEWYFNRIFKLERNLLRAARPIAKRLTTIPIPEDSYFRAIKNVFERLEGVDKVLLDREVTSVRLVTNAEKMVVRETQRAFMYFCLYGLVVDGIIVNRLFPKTLKDDYLKEWLPSQQRSMDQIHRIFDPIPVRAVDILRDEVVGVEKLIEMAKMIYGDADPAQIFHQEPPYLLEEDNGEYTLKMKLPFVTRDYVDLFKESGDLVIRIGSFKRHVFLPRSLYNRRPSKASLDSDVLTIRFSRPV